MSDIETREDEWARGVFDRAHTPQNEPHWIPNAAAAARLSNRRRTRHRVTGALAMVAIVGLSAAAFTALGGIGENGNVSPGTGAVTATHSIPKAGDPLNHLDFMITYDEDSTNPDITAATAASVRHVLTSIDPSGTHLVPTNQSGPPTIGKTMAKLDSFTGHGYWTQDGKAPTSRSDKTKPVGDVVLALLSTQGALTAGGADRPCGLADGVTFHLTPAGPITWSPCVQQKQSDGSEILTTHSVGLPAGEVTIAYRKFPDGSAVALAANSFIEYNGNVPSADIGAPVSPNAVGAGLKPVPWTDSSLAKALSGPDVKSVQ